MLTIKADNTLSEKIYVGTLPMGAKCYIIPKYGFKKSQSVISFSYGANNLKFLLNGKKIESPLGTAHFLEHKMFEKEDKNYFSLFTSSGAIANAFTDCTKTAYYFSSGKGFYKNLKQLTQMVTTASFSPASVEKEKGIIAQEIAMYNDDPSWVSYYNLLKGLYKRHPVKEGIAGTLSQIRGITPEDLYNAYNGFYVPENMNIVVCGDVEVQAVLETIEKNISPEFYNKKAATINKVKEVGAIRNKLVEEDMHLKSPIFNLGFKHIPRQMCLKKIYAMKMLLDIAGGESSYLFSRLQNLGYCQENLGLQYVWGKDFALSVIMGQSQCPKNIANAFVREIARLKDKGINQEEFTRIKKKHIGRFIRGFNSIDAICMAQTDLAQIDADLFQAFDVIKNMEKSYLEELLAEFCPKKATLSVIS